MQYISLSDIWLDVLLTVWQPHLSFPDISTAGDLVDIFQILWCTALKFSWLRLLVESEGPLQNKCQTYLLLFFSTPEQMFSHGHRALRSSNSELPIIPFAIVASSSSIFLEIAVYYPCKLNKESWRFLYLCKPFCESNWIKCQLNQSLTTIDNLQLTRIVLIRGHVI